MTDIFLSHSGTQKPFVRSLYEALQRAGYDPFFDVESLRAGENFPPAIHKALRECHVGVVVLSEEFMSSFWPMKELGFLHSRLQQLRVDDNSSSKHPVIYPIFYKLTPADMKSPQNLSRWRSAWNRLEADKKLKAERMPCDTTLWEDAVRALPTYSGEVPGPGVSEGAFITRIVDKISQILPNPLLYDEAGLSGQDRLKESVVSQFERAKSLCKSTSRACVIGVHGGGGLGKTTLCHLMVNKYFSPFRGKSICLEFPSSADDNLILNLFKKLLKKCSDASEKHVIEEICSLEQVFPQLRKWMLQQDVFLALDNVWSSSADAARRLLEVEFGRESKIMVTSRSKAVLEDILKGCDHATCIQEVASLEKIEALSTLERWFEGDLLSLSESPLLDRLLARCVFNGTFNFLVLQAVGRSMRRRQKAQPSRAAQTSAALLETIEEILSELAGCSEVAEVLSKSYDKLSPTKQRIFLDVAVLFLGWLHRIDFYGSYVSAFSFTVWIKEGLRILYDCSGDDIDKMLHELEADGLLEFRQVRGNEWSISGEILGVHDLYTDLARMEAEKSGRFWSDESNTVNVREASRAFVVSREDYEELIAGGQLGNLEVLIVTGDLAKNTLIQGLGGIEPQGLAEIGGMETLRMLVVDDVDPGIGRGGALGLRRDMWHGKWWGRHGHVPVSLPARGRRLGWLHLVGCHLKGGLSRAEKLRVVVLDCSMQSTGTQRSEWSALVARLPFSKLAMLRLSNVQVEMMNMGRSDCRWLDLDYCFRLQEITGTSFRHLRLLFVNDCRHLRSLPDLNASHNLRQFRILGCSFLTALPALQGCASLQKIHIWQCYLTALPVLEGCAGLQQIYIDDCYNLTALPALEGCASLQQINIRHCHNITALSGLEECASLQQICIENCKNLITLEGCAGLLKIRIHGCDNLPALPALEGCASLQQIDIEHCFKLKALPALEGCVSLQQINIYDCHNLTTLPALEGCASLQQISIHSCYNLTALPALVGCAGLQTIRIRSCNNLSALPLLEGCASLQQIDIDDCNGLTALPALEGCASLQQINIHYCNSLTALPPLKGCARLQQIEISNCKNLTTLPTLDACVATKLKVNHHHQ